MTDAIYIGSTHNRGRKSRWECPICRASKAVECRFSLSVKKDGKEHKCRFCGTELKLVKGVKR